MPRVSIPVTTVTRAGVLDIDAVGLRVLSVPASDHVFVNDGRTVLYVKNNSAGTLSVTVKAQDGGADLVVAMLTLDHLLIGPFSRAKYNVAFTANVYVDVAGVNDDFSFAGIRF